MKLDPLHSRLESFGWSVVEVNGHHMEDIVSSLESLPLSSEKPTAIISNTIKGKGVSFMENVPMWHFRGPNQKEIEFPPGFMNILEACRYNPVEHLVFASSSSVYGANTRMPFSVNHNVDHPLSLYAATKKSNELMAHAYSYLYDIPISGLRFFTVYGPWGRPDMAMFLFTKAILEKKPINVFNQGNMERDFTYINDITEGVVRIVEDNFTEKYNSEELYHLYNIGNNKSVKLMDFIEAIENKLGTTAQKNMMDMQPGDVERTWANVVPLISDYDYTPNTPIQEGVDSFIDWYRKFYNV